MTVFKPQKNAILVKMFEYGHFSKCDYYITYIPSKMPQTSKRLQKLVYGSIYNAWSLSLSHVSTTPLRGEGLIKFHYRLKVAEEI